MAARCLATLALVLLAPAAPAADARWPLDAAARDKLDATARAEKPRSAVEEKVNLTGTVPAFLLTRLALPVEDEVARSKAAHEACCKRDAVVPTPEATARLLDRLVKLLPAYQRPAALKFSLTLFDTAEASVCTPGGGYVHLPQALAKAAAADRDRGEAALAFLLARQLGHVALGHCRRGWQLHEIEEAVRKGIDTKLDPSVWRDLLETKVRTTGDVIQFLYSANQETRVDLYAFHLCRNAGLDPDHALDGMRLLVLKDTADPRAAAWRLKRLLLERDGDVENEDNYGLSVYDRKTDELARCRPGSVTADQRPIVLVHGWYGTQETWGAMLRHLGEQKELSDRPLLVFRHPANGSLARSGRFLANQMKLVVAKPEQATFVCHSAGGLAFRWYAEKLSGGFDRAVFLGTPHGGSDLTGLRFVLDLIEFAGGARKLGLGDGVEKLLSEGRGEIGLDLHPDSLFLRGLARNRKLALRYTLVYGEMLGPIKAKALEVGFAAVRAKAEPLLLPAVPEGIGRRQAEKLLAALVLPAEILYGDGVVSTTSARLSGVNKSTKVRLGHLALRSDPEAMKLTLDAILEK